MAALLNAIAEQRDAETTGTIPSRAISSKAVTNAELATALEQGPGARRKTPRLIVEAVRPLIEVELIPIRESAVCTTMERRDAQVFERSRGHADIDPELAWEQWQIVRTT